MIKKYYLDDKGKLKPQYYFHWKEFKEDGYYFYYFVGVRGAGKTYDGLKWLNDERAGILIRRTDPELEIMLEERNNPLNPLILNGDIESGYIKRTRTKIYNFFTGAPGEEEFMCQGLALNTFAKVRSSDFSFCNNLFWDEFIKQPDQQEMKDEGGAWLNMLETITRNRHHITVVAVANSNDIYNPVFKSLGVVSHLEKLIVKNQPGHKIYKDPKRHLKVIMYEPTKEFIEYKKSLGLYDLTAGTDYAAMAYENQFVKNDFSDCGYKSIVGYVPLFNLDNYCIWKKKGSNEIYVSYAQAECVSYYSKYEIDVELLKNKYYMMLRNRYLKRLITFESYDIKRSLLDLLRLI